MKAHILGAGFALLAAQAAAPVAAAWQWPLPAGIAPPPVPSDNPMSAAKVELGRRLFYDADLSLDGTVSCATCHEQHRAFTVGNATQPGVGGAPGRRNVMALANVAYFDPLTWADPRQRTLEAQTLVPLLGTHPVEMGMAGQEQEISRRLSDDACYRRMFAAAFPENGGRADLPNVTKALAAFERTLLSLDSPYDSFTRGQRDAISPAAARGAQLFQIGCAQCHSGRDFTDNKFHPSGRRGEAGDPALDHGLREITGKAADERQYRTPSLRNVALTGPYMHDGAVPNLLTAVKIHGGVTANEKDIPELMAFLESLTDRSFVTNPDLALPKTACGGKNY